MRRIIVALLFLLFADVSVVQGQCFDRDSLKQVLDIQENSSSIELRHKLNKLVEISNRIKGCPHESDSLQAYILRRIGICFYYLADYINAIYYTNRSIEFVKAHLLNPSVNKKDIVEGYYALQIYYDSLKQDNARMAATDSCIYYDGKYNSDFYYTCILLYEKVNYLFRKGDYDLCIQYATEGEDYTRKYFHGSKDDSLAYATSFLNCRIGSLLFSNQISLAENHLQNKVEEYQKRGNRDALGAIYILIAIVNEYKGNYIEAHSFYEKAFSSELKVGYRKGCAQSLGKLGVLQNTRFRKPEDAWKSFRKALLYATRADSLFLFNKIANVLVEKKMYDSAFSYFDQAFLMIGPGVNEYNLINDSLFRRLNFNYFSEFIVDLVLDKGDAFLHYYRFKKDPSLVINAIRIYKAADKFLARMRMENAEVQSSLTWRNNTRRLYEHAIAACFEAGKPSEAFYFFENSRAVLLNDRLNQQRVLDEKDILRLAQVNKNILRLKTESRNSNTSADQVEKNKNELMSHTRELERLLGIIKVNNPLYYQSFIDSSGITLHDVKNRILIDYKALVEIFAGDSAIYTLMITPTGTDFYKIGKQSFDSLANLYLKLLSGSGTLNSNFDLFIDISSRLYHLLFRDSNIPAGRIIISPDGPCFPFESLVTSISSGKPVYFIQDHSVSYTYSARYLLNTFTPGESSHKNFIGIAPVTYPHSMRLPALAGSDQSLERLGYYFNETEKQVKLTATRNNFIGNYSDYQIVQLYTHASDSSGRGEPVIWFSDSALYLSDLISEKRPLTRLIVLSACLTGSGRLYKGEGVFSFNRGFAALGIPSAITNLWSVDSKATYQLTELFYKYLSEGHPSDVALQKAKLELVVSNNYSLPYYWAAPILTGKAEVLKTENSFGGFWWSVLILIVGVSTYYIFAKKVPHR